MSDNQESPHDDQENPYAAPSEYDVLQSQRLNGRAILAIVVLSILIVPASLIAGFTVCYGTLVATEPLFIYASMWLSLAVGFIVGVLVFALILRRILAISRKRTRPD